MGRRGEEFCVEREELGVEERGVRSEERGVEVSRLRATDLEIKKHPI